MERPINLDYLFTITLNAPKLNHVGDTPHGKRVIANVSGGHFEGPKLVGTVEAPAGDWLLIRSDNSSSTIFFSSWRIISKTWARNSASDSLSLKIRNHQQ